MAAACAPSAVPVAPRSRADAVTTVATALTCGLVLVWPIASFTLAALLLVNLGEGTRRELRWLLGVAVAVSMSLIVGARPLEAGLSNDIDVYHEVYEGLRAGNLDELLSFGAGIEVALPLIMLVLAKSLPLLTANGLMFCFALVASLLMLAWIEWTFYRRGMAGAPALLGLFLVMANLYWATQLSRQFIALVILLFVTTAQGRTGRWACLLLATLMHVSALAFYAIFRLARRGWGGWLAIVLIAWLLRSYFGQLLAALGVLPEAAAEKLAYYIESVDEFTSSDTTTLRTLLMLCALSASAFIVRGARVEHRVWPWLAAPWVAAAVHAILLPIPLASVRTSLAVHAVVPGLLVWMMFSGRARWFARPIFNALLVYKVIALVQSEDSAALWSTVAMLRQFSP